MSSYWDYLTNPWDTASDAIDYAQEQAGAYLPSVPTVDVTGSLPNPLDYLPPTPSDILEAVTPDIQIEFNLTKVVVWGLVGAVAIYGIHRVTR
jgi:hypothetical protein